MWSWPDAIRGSLPAVERGIVIHWLLPDMSCADMGRPSVEVEVGIGGVSVALIHLGTNLLEIKG